MSEIDFYFGLKTTVKKGKRGIVEKVSKRVKRILKRDPNGSPLISKREKFIVIMLVLSGVLFFSEYLLGRSGFYVSFLLAILTVGAIFVSLWTDLKGAISIQEFILPFLFSLSFGLFYFVVPDRFITRIPMSILYAIGLYSLLLSQNIFIVASIRTIPLLSSARTVSFVLSLVTFFFLTNIIFSLHIFLLYTLLLIFSVSFLLILHSLWTFNLQPNLHPNALWALLISLCVTEISLLLWFWPSSPTMISLFLTGFYYFSVGLSHIWLDKRLFKGVLWEYAWVLVASFFVLVTLTSWTGGN